jgi:hypothetical protein
MEIRAITRPKDDNLCKFACMVSVNLNNCNVFEHGLNSAMSWFFDQIDKHVCIIESDFGENSSITKINRIVWEKL